MEARFGKAEIDRLERELRELLREDPVRARQLASAILTSADEVDPGLWGPRPSDEELAMARRRGDAAVASALKVALVDALTREHAAARLGISPQAVSKRVAAGALVALRRGRTRWLPAWQFHEDDALPGLAQVIAAYPGTSLALTVWATSPSADLGGLTPAEAMARRDGAARVVSAAQALAAHL
jgi:hypothetical protein